MFPGADDIIRQHKSACLRITSLMTCKDLLWCGTSAGIIVTVLLPVITASTKRSSVSTTTITGKDDAPIIPEIQFPRKAMSTLLPQILEQSIICLIIRYLALPEFGTRTLALPGCFRLTARPYRPRPLPDLHRPTVVPLRRASTTAPGRRHEDQTAVHVASRHNGHQNACDQRRRRLRGFPGRRVARRGHDGQGRQHQSSSTVAGVKKRGHGVETSYG